MFKNYATATKHLHDKAIAQELVDAGINIGNTPANYAYGECNTRVMGILHQWSFERSWCYWICSGPGVPLDLAIELNKYYADTVRVDGYAGGRCPIEAGAGGGINLYHVDSHDGLLALVSTINKMAEQAQLLKATAEA